MSLYILADTFFIAKSVGANGITALNLVLPLYNLIYAIGAMLGVGSAIRFSIEKNHKDGKDAGYFFHAMLWATLIGFIFVLLGIFVPDRLLQLLGADAEIIATGTSYTRIFMTFAPFFMWNHICNAFVRNDGSPSIAMAATLVSSLFNIVMDYVLMFPMGLAMRGAALATAFSPIVGVTICCIHFASKKCSISFRPVLPSIRKLGYSCQVGVSAFVGEISSGVITVAFNMIILHLAGNTGVAAYGVVANTSLVAVSLFNGIAQGAQPLVSECYGKGRFTEVKKVVRMGMKTAFGLAVLLLVGINLWAEPIVRIFNSENNATLSNLAESGLKLYFIGFLFAGINIVGTSVLSAVESVRWAFTASIMRGFIVILICAFVLSALFQMTGVWLAFPTAEAMTLLITGMGMRKSIFQSKN